MAAPLPTSPPTTCDVAQSHERCRATLLARLHANKAELLMVLDRPEIPLHTNGSENVIRAFITKRKVSGGTRSDEGRDCRDAFLSLLKTCKKLDNGAQQPLTQSKPRFANYGG